MATEKLYNVINQKLDALNKLVDEISSDIDELPCCFYDEDQKEKIDDIYNKLFDINEYKYWIPSDEMYC